MFKKIITSAVVSVAAIAGAAVMALPASASTGSVPVPVPITGIHPGIHHPGLGLRPGIGIGGCGLGSCGAGISSCGIGLGSCGLSTCSTCGLGYGLGSPIYVSQVPWYGISSASLCNVGCGGVGISNLPSVVYVNGNTGACAYWAGGRPIPSLYGIGGLGLRNSLGLGLR